MTYRTREQIISTTAHEVYQPGEMSRPKYNLYDLWKLPAYHAFSNELDELLERWPVHQTRTVALLAVRQAFFINGATHWEVESYQDELLVNSDVAARIARERAREAYPELVTQYNRNLALAEDVLVERERRKQGPPTGKAPCKQRLPGGPKPVRISRNKSRTGKSSLGLSPNAQLISGQD